MDRSGTARRTLIAHARSQARDSDQVAILAHGLGQFLISRAAFAQADPLTELALTIAENLLGPNHPHVAFRLTNRALALKGLNRVAEAEALLKRAIDISEQHPEPRDVTNFVIQLSNLGRVLQDLDRTQEAEELYRRALRLAEEQALPDARLIGTVPDNLGTVLQETNRFVAAEPLHKRALALKKQAFGPNHPNMAATLNNLASVLRHTNRQSDAEPLYREVLRIWEEVLHPSDPRIAVALNNLAELLYHTHRLEEAEPLLRRALLIDRKSLTAENPDLASHLHNLAHLLSDTGRHEEAEPLMREAIGILVRYGAFTGHVIPKLRFIVKIYHLVLTALGQSEPEMIDTIRELGRPLGFDIFRWAAFDLFEVRPPL